MLQGFKEFILRGNVVELAVAVVIGSAFTAIVTAVTNNLINPLIASVGGAEVPGFGIQIIPSNPNTFINFGAVITAVLNFLIISAVVYFILIVPMNKLSELQKRRHGIKEKKEEEDSASLEAHLLEEIRDLLLEQKRAGLSATPHVAEGVAALSPESTTGQPGHKADGSSAPSH